MPASLRTAGSGIASICGLRCVFTNGCGTWVFYELRNGRMMKDGETTTKEDVSTSNMTCGQTSCRSIERRECTQGAFYSTNIFDILPR